MRKLDEKGAPAGYSAVASGLSCIGCAFEPPSSICWGKDCVAEELTDNCDVIFKKKGESNEKTNS